MICRLLTVFDTDIGRGGGIRTPGPRKGSPVFKTGAINHSTTPLKPLTHCPTHVSRDANLYLSGVSAKQRPKYESEKLLILKAVSG
jgi:hypothetical protein